MASWMSKNGIKSIYLYSRQMLFCIKRYRLIPAAAAPLFYPFLVFKNDGMGEKCCKKYEEKSFEKLAKTAYFKRSI